jgi:hypothetical protein
MILPLQILRKMKAPMALFAVLLLLAIEAMAASETLHHALHGDEDHEAQPCAVKLFSKGMVDVSPVGVTVTRIESVSLLEILPLDLPVVCDLGLLPPGRGPPAFVS